ncbi:BTB/POZ and TAZ domain-containing protein 2-like [Typha angustifolia]|uniref:BTB/POZ and TAZ domain-containing protein 2-like n=1 Tax=Typha angustifolia TaxID=59011 RepID=UPI003C2CDBD1
MDAGHDIQIVTSDGRRIPAHLAVLASASSVMASILDRTRGLGDSGRVIMIPGVPCDAVVAFVRLLYSSTKGEKEAMGFYGMHLLVLSHVYGVAWLKRACEAALASRLTSDTVVDVLHLARQCDAPALYLRCMKLLAKYFADVEKSEAWKFVQAYDPWLELEILQFLQEAELRHKRRRRKRVEQGIYIELSEAMECLRHIYTEGCTDVRPLGRSPPLTPCAHFSTCRGLQLLIRHFASCHRKNCTRCCRMWQLLQLHSALCEQPTDPCKVPLCMEFKLKMQQMEGKMEDNKWRLLVKKVMAVRVMSSLSKRRERKGVFFPTAKAE